MAPSSELDDAAAEHPRQSAELPCTASLLNDLRACEWMISYAAHNGLEVSREDVAAVGAAQAACRDQGLTPELKGSFYEAMSRIARCVAPATAETLDPCNRPEAKRALRCYSHLTAAMTVIVILLSSALLTMTRLSDEITKIVKENDDTARTLHNELQGYILAMGDSKTGNPGGHNLLVNAPSSLELKEHLQSFARNNRQLYSDIKYLNNLWAPVADIGNLIVEHELRWDVKSRNPYAGRCNANHYMAYLVIDPNPLVYEVQDQDAKNYPWNMRVNPTFNRYPFYSVEKPYGTPWMCDPDLTRAALEIKLPLLRVGSVDPQDQFEPPLAEFDVQQGFSKIAVYQDIRAISLILVNEIATFAGGISGFVLPILYATLGACAKIFRELRVAVFEDTYDPKHARVVHTSRFIAASIVGISIGLFTTFLKGENELPPLAVAFVAGYASDEFFDFIERIVKAMFPPKD
ncbi:hypothetical protein [Paraburkholderia sp. CI3]|uniref:hypothetical protein n=1 Tax=Paraburkholderia sp. CI3 TaxID=2991060 RepID=UPI003D194490